MLKAWPLEPGTLIVPEPSDQTKSTEKIAPYFKGTPALPLLDWEKSQHYNDDVTCEGCGVSSGIIEYHIESSENRNGKLKVKLFASRFGWMFQHLVNVCLPPTREDYL